MLFVGSMEPRKNLERVVAAYSRLRADETIPHHLVIAGPPGWKNGGVHRAIATSPVRDMVITYGISDDETLAALYAHADFLVAPSLYEGFGLAIVEALSFGTPVLTSRISSLPEVAGAAGLLVDPTSVEEIVEGMRNMACNRKLRDDLASRARRQASRFSWKRAAQRTLAVFQETVAVRQSGLPEEPRPSMAADRAESPASQ
jgi:glycosyltransferase involved in cell wall biosynthesis